jgi:amino-acid N-acetyltransferase
MDARVSPSEFRKPETLLRVSTMSATVFRVASANDTECIWALLEASGLPTADLARSRPEFFLACEGPRVIGVGGLEQFGAAGLLRSVAVVPDRRGLGIASTIVGHLEDRARQLGLSELVLLTQTAKKFFERHAYRIIERQRAPAEVQQSEEFRSLCPSSAFCLSKRLAEPSSLRQANG